jgi:hypothetical protein
MYSSRSGRERSVCFASVQKIPSCLPLPKAMQIRRFSVLSIRSTPCGNGSESSSYGSFRAIGSSVLWPASVLHSRILLHESEPLLVSKVAA